MSCFKIQNQFLTAKDHRQPLRRARPDHRWHRADLNGEHVLVEKQQRAKRLILCRSADAAINSQPRQELSDFRCPYRGRVRFAMKEDVPPNPAHIRFLGSTAVMPGPNRVAHAIEQLGRLSHSRLSGETHASRRRNQNGANHGDHVRTGQFLQTIPAEEWLKLRTWDRARLALAARFHQPPPASAAH